MLGTVDTVAGIFRMIFEIKRRRSEFQLEIFNFQI